MLFRNTFNITEDTIFSKDMSHIFDGISLPSLLPYYMPTIRNSITVWVPDAVMCQKTGMKIAPAKAFHLKKINTNINLHKLVSKFCKQNVSPPYNN